MPRRSLRAASATSRTNTPRKAESSLPSPESLRSKRSIRGVTNGNGTATKKVLPSRTAQADDSDVDSELSSAASDAADEEASGYEDEDASETEPEEEEDDYDSEQSNRPKKKRKSNVAARASSTPTASASKLAKAKTPWRPYLSADYEPGVEVIIDAPKARPAGSTPYTNETIHPNTFLFLAELAKNNDRAWLKHYDLDYRQAHNDFTTFLGSVQEKLMQLDETIPDLPVKDVIFRIYRDVRFSKDQTPYKTHFSAAFSRTGRKGPFACYYLQVKTGGSYIGGGLWCPDAAPTAALRRAFDRKPHKIREMLMSPGLRKHFLGGIPANAEKAVKAFVAHNAGNALKTKPKGYDASHPDIALMRLKNFTLGRKLSDNEVAGKGGLKRIAELFEAMVPFITYLNSVVMPDGDEDDDNDDEEEEEDDDEDDNNQSDADEDA